MKSSQGQILHSWSKVRNHQTVVSSDLQQDQLQAFVGLANLIPTRRHLGLVNSNPELIVEVHPADNLFSVCEFSGVDIDAIKAMLG